MVYLQFSAPGNFNICFRCSKRDWRQPFGDRKRRTACLWFLRYVFANIESCVRLEWQIFVYFGHHSWFLINIQAKTFSHTLINTSYPVMLMLCKAFISAYSWRHTCFSSINPLHLNSNVLLRKVLSFSFSSECICSTNPGSLYISSVILESWIRIFKYFFDYSIIEQLFRIFDYLIIRFFPP